MKKINLFLISMAVSLAFTSCIDFSNTDSGITAPSVSKTAEDGIVIVPTNLTSAQYINIFRYEVSDNTSSATVVDDSTYNIGMIVKTDYYTNSGAVTFIDYYTDSSKYYQYYIRYKTSSGYLTSETSGTISGMGKFAGTTTVNGDYVSTSGEASITVGTSGSTTIIYSGSTAYTLMINKNDIAIPYIPSGVQTDSEGNAFQFTPMLAVNNGTTTLLFEMTTYTSSDSTAYWYLDLYKNIPESFFDTDLTIKGIVGQQTISETLSEIESSTVKYYNYTWTLPLTTFTTDMPDNVEVINVASDSSDIPNYDYTTNKIITEEFLLQS